MDALEVQGEALSSPFGAISPRKEPWKYRRGGSIRTIGPPPKAPKDRQAPPKIAGAVSRAIPVDRDGEKRGAAFRLTWKDMGRPVTKEERDGLV